MEPLPVYILAGGHSSRFGSDKALALLDGTPLIARIATAVAPVASSITVVAERADRYQPLGLRTIPDLTPHLGPLGGLETALADCQSSEWLLLLSCDLLQVRPEWLEQLAAHRAGDTRAVAFKPDRWQPLLALYRQTLLPIVQTQLRSGCRRMQSLLDLVNAVAPPTPGDWPARLQANTPAELSSL